MLQELPFYFIFLLFRKQGDSSYVMTSPIQKINNRVPARLQRRHFGLSLSVGRCPPKYKDFWREKIKDPGDLAVLKRYIAIINQAIADLSASPESVSTSNPTYYQLRRPLFEKNGLSIWCKGLQGLWHTFLRSFSSKCPYDRRGGGAKAIWALAK